MHDLIRGVN